VIFATEALGLGVNLLDVRRIILYSLPKGGSLLLCSSKAVELAEMDRIVI
jgi:hypothetical protein